MQIPIELLIKYQMAFEGETFEDSMSHYEDEKHFYETFLIQTDHIPNKIIEYQYLGKSTGDLKEIVNIREECRNKIRQFNE